MAFDAFLKLKGIDGESQDDKHSKWIEILSYSFNASQMTAGARSTGGSANKERVNLSDLTIVKALDVASPKIFLACCNGEPIGEAVIELCRATKDKTKYLEIKMTDVVISSYAPGGSKGGDDLPTEQVSFNYGKIEVIYTATDLKTGKAAGDVKAHWDLVKNTGG